jgi:hypothetical protein
VWKLFLKISVSEFVSSILKKYRLLQQIRSQLITPVKQICHVLANVVWRREQQEGPPGHDQDDHPCIPEKNSTQISYSLFGNKSYFIIQLLKVIIIIYFLERKSLDVIRVLCHKTHKIYQFPKDRFYIISVSLAKFSLVTFVIHFHYRN